MPAPPWTPDAYRPGLEIDGLRHGRFLASYMVDFGALTFYDRERRAGLYWAADAPALAACQEAAPLRNVLRWIAVDHGGEIVHAAAVGRGEDGVLILGAKGAGKSTTSLACMLEGLDFVADDFCLLDQQDGTWLATPLTHTARAEEGTLALLPQLRERITNHGAPADHKAELTVADRLARGLRIRALTTPERATRTAPARRVDRTTFVRSVLAGTVGVFPGNVRGGVAAARATQRRSSPVTSCRSARNWPVQATAIAALVEDRAGGGRMSAADVSVIMPAYNTEQYIGEAIASVLESADRLLELIVVDDGSTDGTAAIAESFGEPVRVIRQENRGPSAARNVAMAAARGTYLGFLDSDDIWAADAPGPTARCAGRRPRRWPASPASAGSSSPATTGAGTSSSSR